MKTFSKIAIVLLPLLACSTFSCKKELAPLSVSPKNAALLSSSVYGQVTTFITGAWQVGPLINNTAPKAIAVDAAHNLYVGNAQILKITPAGVKTVLADLAATEPKDATGAVVHFGFVSCMTFGPDSALYAVDYSFPNVLIRKITLRGVVTTYVGRPGFPGMNDGPVAQATVDGPLGIASCAQGNLYIAEPFGPGPIRVITPGAGGIVYTIYRRSGPFFSYPSAVAIYQGNVYFSDLDNNVIEKIAPDGTLSTFATGIGGAGYDIVVDSSGNLYASDNGGGRILKITPDGVVSVLAGGFSNPYGLAIDGDYLYVADVGSGSILKIVIK